MDMEMNLETVRDEENGKNAGSQDAPVAADDGSYSRPLSDETVV